MRVNVYIDQHAEVTFPNPYARIEVRGRMEAPQPLLDDIAAGRCLPFIGAGFSLNAALPRDRSMPDWNALTAQLAATVGVPFNLGGPEVAAQYERKFGRVGLIEAIRKALNPDVARPGAAHLALAELPFDTIYTTNFDLLLEQGWEQTRKPYRSLAGELQMPFHAGYLTTNIIKMHGDIRHEEHFIATTKDYESFLGTYPVIATHLSAMLITKTGFFLVIVRPIRIFSTYTQLFDRASGAFSECPTLSNSMHQAKISSDHSTINCIFSTSI